MCQYHFSLVEFSASKRVSVSHTHAHEHTYTSARQHPYRYSHTHTHTRTHTPLWQESLCLTDRFPSSQPVCTREIEAEQEQATLRQIASINNLHYQHQLIKSNLFTSCTNLDCGNVFLVCYVLSAWVALVDAKPEVYERSCSHKKGTV